MISRSSAAPKTGVRNILVVDDEISMCDFLTVVLGEEGYKVKAVQDGEKALALLQEVHPEGSGAPAEEKFSCMILDLKMPRIGGLEVLRKARALCPELGVVVITAYASLESAVEALRLGAMDYVTKPFKVEEIKIVIEKVFDQIALRRENVHLRRQLSEKTDLGSIIGKSEEMQRLLGFVRRVAPTDSTILITGESGTGKELIAQAIHLHSRRAEGPFVSINCGALPESLLESELFGHMKGSFTGAIKNKDGLFKVADGGTIFLDEIGETLPTIQVKLLRVLQEKEIMPDRRHQTDAGGCPGVSRHQCGFGGKNQTRRIPHRPVLPIIGNPNSSGIAQGTPRRHSFAGKPFSEKNLHPE